MNKIKFAIPSYKRSEEQLTLSYLEEMGYSKDDIYISTQTLDDYNKYSEKYSKRAHIIYNEGNCVSDNRNTLLDYFPEGQRIIMLDDDIKYIGTLKGKKIEPFTKEELAKFINDAFNYCEKNHALIWGGYPVENYYFMKRTIDKKNLLIGTILGIINSKYRFNNEFKIKEDFELCLHMMKDGYNSIRFNFLHAPAKHKTAGGCMEDWVKDEECTKKILLKYPNLIRKGCKNNSILMKGNKNGKR